MIKQKELEAYMSAQDKLKKAQQRLTLESAKLSDKKAQFEKRFKDGEKVEMGKFMFFMKETVSRASISWKSVVEQLKGKLYVEQMLAKAERKVRHELIIIERDTEDERRR